MHSMFKVCAHMSTSMCNVHNSHNRGFQLIVTLQIIKQQTFSIENIVRTKKRHIILYFTY